MPGQVTEQNTIQDMRNGAHLQRRATYELVSDLASSPTPEEALEQVAVVIGMAIDASDIHAVNVANDILKQKLDATRHLYEMRLATAV